MIYFFIYKRVKEGIMRTAGIICEYNPFHTGHKRQIDILHGMGYDCVVCVMSGNYTQRGELALFDKYTRAKSAVLGGADIVLELPFPYSSFSAEGFASSGVFILASLGVEAICFGSECGDISLLEIAADALLREDFSDIYSKHVKCGRGSAAAYFDAIAEITGRDISLLSNDILGISYVAAIKRGNYKFDILPIKREGAAYNEKELKSGIMPSASAIRECIKNSTDNLKPLLGGYIPDSSLDCFINARNNGLAPVFAKNIGTEILSFFKLMSPKEIEDRAISRSGGGDKIAEDGCGICERLCNTAHQSCTYGEFLKRSYTAKYPDARINRVILFSLLGVSDRISHSLPKYTTLLAANGSGREFLSQIRKTCGFTIVTKPADAPEGTLQRKISDCADSLYSRAIPSKKSEDFFIKSRPYVIK